MKLIKYPSIKNFPEFFKEFKHHMCYIGPDKTGEPLYDLEKTLPIVDVVCTIKTHGTNASVVLSPKNDVYAQSKANVLKLTEDNAGFANYVDQHSDTFFSLLDNIRNNVVTNTLLLDDTYVTVYGEWIGKGIQKGCAIHQIEHKTFIVFGIKITIDNESTWVDYSKIEELVPSNTNINLFNIFNFKTYNISLDLNDIGQSIHVLNEIMLEIEDECPVGNYFGFKGIGEGLVGYFKYDGETHRFKVKGLAHGKAEKASRIKMPLTPEQLELLSNKKRVAETVTPQWRLEQGLSEVFDLINGGELTNQKIGDYIKWVINDIVKEDISVIQENNLILKDVTKDISIIARNYYFEQYNEQLIKD